MDSIIHDDEWQPLAALSVSPAPHYAATASLSKMYLKYYITDSNVLSSKILTCTECRDARALFIICSPVSSMGSDQIY